MASSLETIQEKNMLIAEIKRLSNLLDTHYNLELNFRNHCYLRIAYDCTVNNKWDFIIKKPFIKYAGIVELNTAINLLNTYLIDKKKLLVDNDKSLSFRKNIDDFDPTDGLRLF